LTKKFSVPNKVVEGSAENAKLFSPNDCVVHNFIIGKNSNGHDAYLPEEARGSQNCGKLWVIS